MPSRFPASSPNGWAFKMDTVRVRIPFPYNLEYLPTRGKGSLTVSVMDSVEAVLPVVSPLDAPIRIQAKDIYCRHDRRAFDGELYGSTMVFSNPIMLPGKSQPLRSAFDTLAISMRTLFHEDDPIRLSHDLTKTDVRPEDVGTIIHDDRDAMAGIVLAAARDLIVVGAEVFRKSPVPVLELRERSHVVEDFLLGSGDRRLPRYRFALDRMDEMNSIVGIVEGRGGIDVRHSAIRIEKVDWDLSTVGEADDNATCAIDRAHYALADCMGWAGSDVLMQAARLAECRDNPVPGVTPATVLRILQDLHDGVPRKEPGTLYLRRQLAMAIDFVGASRDFDPSPLDEDDVVALGTLGHMTP